MNITTHSIKTLTPAVIASGARQSSPLANALFVQSGLPRRYAPRNDGEGIPL